MACKATRRSVDLVVISDVHLGTYGCRAKALVQYLKTIRPQTLVLNGDIIDVWQFSKRYWPKSHTKVIKELMNAVSEGIQVYYVTGNHDEMLRRYVGFELGSLKVVNKVLLPLADGKQAWIFHGDVFDITMQHSKWLTRLGAIGYDTLILLNSLVNFVSEKIFRKGKISISKKIKNSVKSAVKFINSFEQTAAEIGISNGYDYVVCGHIHHPEIRTITTEKGQILYCNSGDWIENLTALEYHEGEWTLYHHPERQAPVAEEPEAEPSTGELFETMLEEFNMLRATATT
jgi:UDP-2,3-diacylglucosamine pyrophosphatase LpxH